MPFSFLLLQVNSWYAPADDPLRPNRLTLSVKVEYNYGSKWQDSLSFLFGAWLLPDLRGQLDRLEHAACVVH